MKTVYPVVFTKIEEGYLASAPDFPLDTQGADIADAIFMVRDAIGLIGIDMEDEHKELPRPSALSEVPHEESDIVSLVDIDFAEYRRKHDRRTVRRNVSLPSWLNEEAEKASLNVSAVLQAALKKELKIQ